MTTSERQTKAMRTRRRVVAAAAAEFADHGFDGTSLRQVAASAGLQLGSLYFHFASKDELLTEVLREAVDLAVERIDVAVAQLPVDATGADRLRSAIGAHLEVLHRSRDLGAAVVRVMDPGVSAPQAARDHARRYVARWRQIIAEAHGSSNDEGLTSVLLLGAMNATVGRRAQSTTDIARITAGVQRHFAPP